MALSHGIGVALLGLGVVGSGVAQALLHSAAAIDKKAGTPVRLRHILVRDLEKPRPFSPPPGLLTTSADAVLSDPHVHVVVEVMGGEHPAVDYIRRAISQGKHVVTANKEVMAKHGPELVDLAQKRRVSLLFEASVGGGIPIIGPLMKDLLANEVKSIHAIINGTTNYILTRMSTQGLDFQEALREAQRLGYAEPDPTNDIEGIDAAYKLAILATLAFHTRVRPEDIYHEGISRLQARDFRYAQELGYAIKLLAITRHNNGSIQVRVHPALVPLDHLLAKVEGAFNAIEVEGDLVGRVVFHGLGAGPLPTTSAVVGDLLEVARRMASGNGPVPMVRLEDGYSVQPMAEVKTMYYIRLSVADRAGVLAQIARVLGDLNISIASVIQKDADAKAGTAELVIMTHPSREADVQTALERLKGLPVVAEISNFIRVEH